MDIKNLFPPMWAIQAVLTGTVIWVVIVSFCEFIRSVLFSPEIQESEDEDVR